MLSKVQLASPTMCVNSKPNHPLSAVGNVENNSKESLVSHPPRSTLSRQQVFSVDWQLDPLNMTGVAQQWRC